MRSVLVTRPQPVADEFAEKLRREGFHPYVAPMMEYIAADFLLPDMSQFQALVFTSAQGVKVFSARMLGRDLPVLTVGGATAMAALHAGFTKIFSAQGDSEDVAALVKKEAASLGLKKILHVCGEDTAGDIGAAVAGSGVEVERLPVYKAQFLDRIPEEVLKVLQQGGIDIVTVFSDRTAENFVKLMAENNMRTTSARLEAICISDRIAGTLRELPWRVIRVVHQPSVDAVMAALKEENAAAIQERRRKVERRQKIAFRDARGYIDSEAYKGIDRRTGQGRRAHEKLQKKRILQERMKFLNRSVLTFAFMFIAIVLIGVFLMAPEYAQLSGRSQWMDYLQKRVHSSSPPAPGSFGSFLNHIIETIQGTSAPLTDVAGQIAASTGQAIRTQTMPDFSQVLTNISQLRRSDSGDEAVTQSMGTLRELLASSSGDHPEEFNRSVEKARKKDPTLNSLLGSVKKEDLAAGAMLLVLNEFRSNVDNHRPYVQDLALLQKFAGNDPAMNRALRRLAPYAERGVMSREALQGALKGVAGDIVTAKLQGKDVSVQEAARQRLEVLSQTGDAQAVKGETTEAVVARAQLLLDKGDVKGAIRELQALDGAAAQTAEPWMDNAAGYVVAGPTSDDLTQGMLQSMSGEDNFSVSGLMDLIKESLQGPSVPYISPALTKGGDGGKNVVVPKY
jgi:uroporphyrinogen-III synthase